MRPDPHRLLDGAAGVAHPLEASVIDPVHVPAVHPAYIELAIGGAEPAAVDAGPEVSDERHDGSLRLTGHLVAKHEKMRA